MWLITNQRSDHYNATCQGDVIGRNDLLEARHTDKHYLSTVVHRSTESQEPKAHWCALGKGYVAMWTDPREDLLQHKMLKNITLAMIKSCIPYCMWGGLYSCRLVLLSPVYNGHVSIRNELYNNGRRWTGLRNHEFICSFIYLFLKNHKKVS